MLMMNVVDEGGLLSLVDDEDELLMKVVGVCILMMKMDNVCVCLCPVVSAVPDLVGRHEEEHRSVEAGPHLLLPHPLLHQPHLLQVRLGGRVGFMFTMFIFVF